MLIPDLLNILFDQSDYHGIIVLMLVNKRKTKYADKYSLGRYYVVDTSTYGDDCDIPITEFIKSVNDGKLKTMKYLVNTGIDVDTADEYALKWSAYNGNIEMVKYLMNEGADVHEGDDDYVNGNALCWGIDGDNMSVAKYLISVGANVNACDGLALSLGAKNGNFELVKYLISVGADVCNSGALKWSAEKDNLEIFKYLINVGADGHICDYEELHQIGCHKVAEYLHDWLVHQLD